MRNKRIPPALPPPPPPPVMCSVNESLMKRIYFVLETGRDNAIEVYNDHVNECSSSGVMTKRNETIKLIMQEDIDEVESVIAKVSKQWKFGV